MCKSRDKGAWSFVAAVRLPLPQLTLARATSPKGVDKISTTERWNLAGFFLEM